MASAQAIYSHSKLDAAITHPIDNDLLVNQYASGQIDTARHDD